MKSLKDMADDIRQLAIFASILKSPDEFFKHMNGHTTELSLVLRAFEIANNSEAIANVIEQQLNNGWIPVDNILPCIGKNVFVTYKNGDREMDFIQANGKWSLEDKEKDMIATAWKPL